MVAGSRGVNQPLPRRKTVVSPLRKQCLCLLYSFEKSPLQKSRIGFTESLLHEYRTRRRSGHAVGSFHNELFYLTMADGGTGKRKGWNQCMGFPASPAPNAQHVDLFGVVVFPVSPVTGKRTKVTTVWAGFLSDNRSPEHFYPSEAIVSFGYVD